ncbi:tribbles homolog 2 [Cylas formicarius]|uniref:tribbles homolog 2 n=1 Tax=Cylas formicarius TaxID=197179 RepID=UPI0029587F6C|nr:tribbles homolog 2 [Cylas formicarius]
MQKVQDLASPAMRLLQNTDKVAASGEPGTSGGDAEVKEIRLPSGHSRDNTDVELRVPKVSDRDTQRAPFAKTNNPYECDGSKYRPLLVADKYEVHEQVIGSSLYRCVNIHTREELVCKMVNRENQSLMSAHFRLESHPRVQPLHEVVVSDRFLYLVFPKAHGDLHSYVRQRKRLRESEAKKLFRQIAEIVQHCHQNGIILRDLKLRKFVFADPERTELKLESFEDAVVLEEPESDWLNDKRGCPAYVSPEILRTGKYSGKSADMWSLGVILYTMLIGRYPFNDAGHVHLFARISSGNYVIPDCVSARARCLIRSLLRRDPSERINSEDIMYHPWLAKEEKEWMPRSCDQMVPSSSLYDD